jgi:hypothetical protein
MLTMYVSRRFLHGWLHTSGGIVFYLLGLLALLPILVLLKRGESRDRLSVSSQAEGSISEARSEDRRIAAISSAKRN